MTSLFLLLPISLFLVVMIGVAFWWAIFSGQFDNTQEAAHSILLDDDSTTDTTPSPPAGEPGRDATR